jgi:hypothetical protein
VAGEERFVARHLVVRGDPLPRHDLVDGVDEPERRPVRQQSNEVVHGRVTLPASPGM